MSITPELLKKIVEATLLAASKPLNISQLQDIFDDDEAPSKEEFEAALEDIKTDMGDRGFELIEVASGWRFQVKQELAPWIGKLWEEKPKKYSRAVLETLALVAYRQPITRGDIEQIRGVAVSSDIIRGLLDRDWVKVVGHKDVPGRPAMYATTKEFLDYFNLKSLEDLPTLAEIRDLDSLNTELNLEDNLPPIKASLEFTEEDLSEETIQRKVEERQTILLEEDAEQAELKDDYNDDLVEELDQHHITVEESLDDFDADDVEVDEDAAETTIEKSNHEVIITDDLDHLSHEDLESQNIE